MTKTLFYALEDFEYAVRCNCQCCVTDAEATTDAQVNEARQKALDAALAERDAKVRGDALREVERSLGSIIAGWKAATSGTRRQGTYPPLNEHVLGRIKSLLEGEA